MNILKGEKKKEILKKRKKLIFASGSGVITPCMQTLSKDDKKFS